MAVDKRGCPISVLWPLFNSIWPKPSMDNTRWRWVRGTGQKWSFCDVLARPKAATAIILCKKNLSIAENCVSRPSKWRWLVVDIELNWLLSVALLAFLPERLSGNCSSGILTWRRGKLWSTRKFPQGEAAPLHYGVVDPCDFPKCGKLGRTIFVSGDLRSR